MIAFFEQAYQREPLLIIAAVLATLILAWRALFGRGGVNAEKIIAVYSFAATVVSVLKAFFWMLGRMGKVAAEEPTGTDLLLLMGAFVAILFASTQGIVTSLRGSSGQTSTAGRWLSTTRWGRALPPWLAALLGFPERIIEGELPQGPRSPPSDTK
jgi:hypothetical protein